MGASTTNSEILIRFDESGGRRAVILEDDGRVAYAYLLEDEEIVGDVWLYNVEQTPDTVNWKDRAAMPFLNPRPFCRDADVPRIGQSVPVHCQWSETGVEVSIDGVLLARLERGAKPGWSKLAIQPGPLAKPLQE
jgi:hypothetical protein